MDEGQRQGDGGGVTQEERGGDRWTDRDGDRGTAIRVWDICMATREDRKSRWWMGGPTRGYRGGREDDNGWKGARERRGGGRWRGQECDHSEGVRVDQEGARVERSCLMERQRGRRVGGGGAGEERKVYSLGQAVITGAGCSPWRSELAWPAVVRTQGVVKKGGRGGWEEEMKMEKTGRWRWRREGTLWEKGGGYTLNSSDLPGLGTQRWRDVYGGVGGGTWGGPVWTELLILGREADREMQWREQHRSTIW